MINTITFAFSFVEVTHKATITASSFYNIPPFEKSFLPSLVADNDDNTAWSSLGEGCDAKLFFEFEKEEKITKVCARTRDMVDDPNVPSTDDSVIEKYDLLLDEVEDATCTLPDWRQIYCCSVLNPKPIKKLTLAANQCREREGGPANTGFKTIKVYIDSPMGSDVLDVALFGNDNTLQGSATNVKIFSSNTESKFSDSVTAVGHRARNLESDNTNIVGNDINITSSDNVVVLGNNLNIVNADYSILIGNDLKTTTPTQVIFGRYNLDSDAKFVLADGNSEKKLNLLEVYADGTIINNHITKMDERIKELEEKVKELEKVYNRECQKPDCQKLELRYEDDGCCTILR